MMNLASVSYDLLRNASRKAWEHPFVTKLRPVAGEMLLSVSCRVLSDPLNTPVIRRYLHGPGLFPVDRVRYAKRLGMRMKLNLHDRISRLIYFVNCHEPDETRVMRRIVRRDSTVLDVGAHIGYYSLLMARLVDPCLGHVYAFEPNPETFRILNEHVEINQLTHVTPLNLALGASVHRAELFQGVSHHSGIASLFLPENTGGRAAVNVTTLDRFFSDRGLDSLDFVKIDIEGSEVDMLEGGREVLALHTPHMLIEVNPPMLAQGGHCARDLVGLLHGLGYAVFQIDRAHTEITLADAEDMGFANVYCVPRSRC